ncbi:MAG: hypothetical protein WBD20_21485 [Pirellulaceae bacterium]
MQVTKQIWQDLIDGRKAIHGNIPEKPLLFPGSFNPVHEGHRQMASIASDLIGQPIHPEISIVNVDKDALDYDSLLHRMGESRQLGNVVITRAARFVEKAMLFQNATFVIGADTAIRLDQTRYYEDSANLRDQAIENIASLGTTFLVFGRKVDDEFHDACHLKLSSALSRLCKFVPATKFRIDISSTQLRQQQ